jgi:hypothetical protein
MHKLIGLAVLLAVVAASVGGALPAFAHEDGNDFVCPVFNEDSKAGEKNPNAHPIGGDDVTIIPGENTGEQRANHLDIPDKATNGDGDGTPGGDHSSTGDSDYSGVWDGD